MPSWAHAGLGNPQASTSTVLGMLPPQGRTLAAAGTALAAERTESLQGEEMPGVSRLVLYQRDTPEMPAGQAGFLQGRQNEWHPL